MLRTTTLLLLLAACGEGVSAWPGKGPGRSERFRVTYADRTLPAPLGNPPDGFEMGNGYNSTEGYAQWGVDVDESKAVTLTGERSIWFKPTSRIQSYLQHDMNHQAPVQAGRRYKAHAVFQSPSATSNMFSQVEWMGADRTTRVGTSTLHTGAVAAVNTWERAEAVVECPSRAYYARILFGRSGASTDAYYDEVDMIEAVPLWKVSMSGSQVVSNGGEVVVFDTADEQTDVEFDSGTGTITIVTPGLYYVNAGVYWDGMTSGDNDISTEIRVNGSRVFTGSYLGSLFGTDVVMPASTMLNLQAGDDVTVFANQLTGSNRTITGSLGSVDTYFQGFRVL